MQLVTIEAERSKASKTSGGLYTISVAAPSTPETASTVENPVLRQARRTGTESVDKRYKSEASVLSERTLSVQQGARISATRAMFGRLILYPLLLVVSFTPL